MKRAVKIGPLLQENAQLPDAVEVDCDTVRQCLDQIVKLFPESKDWLYDEDSLIKVLLTINSVEAITLNEEGLNRPLRPGDELQIFAMVSGG
jgi:molybdopterin converting factor small subunit